jgi:glyoxylase-like metal-dependent hydrolase (beta-lactamase superfamily II)
MITRRAFIRTIGRGSAAVALVGVTACTSEEPTATTTAGERATTAAPADGSTTPADPTTASTSVETSTTAPTTSIGAWSRVSFGFVSAYVLVRSGEAALVDTGTSGSASQVESTLDGLGLGWGELGTIVLTHHHGDHIGSLPEMMEAAAGATAYAGAEDIPNIPSPRSISAVADGDTVFGLQVVATPGHTPGHISILDPSGSTLIAGDALIGEGGGVAGPSAQFTADMATANESVVKLAGLDFEVVYFGHGEPVTSEASAQVAELAAGL